MIKKISEDILRQLVKDFKESNFYFILQLDKTCDEAHFSQFVVFLRCSSEKTNSIHEKFLMYRPLIATTKAMNIYHLIDEFFF